MKNDLTALLTINSLPLVDFSETLANYNGNVSFIIGEKDPILRYVKKAQQISKSAQIDIIPHKNHMQLFFSSTEIVISLYNFIAGLRNL